MKYHMLLAVVCSITVGTSNVIKGSINDALNQLKNTFSGAGGIVQGLEQSFGYVGPDYVYSYRVFNDAPAPIVAATQRITPVLGAKFSGEVKKGRLVLPFTNTQDAFYDQNLYLDVWLLKSEQLAQDYTNYQSSTLKKWDKYSVDTIRKWTEIGTIFPGLGSALGALAASIFVEAKLEDKKILHKKISLGKKNDKNIYFYRAYSDKGELKGEYLGINTVTSDFVGVFYNSSNKDVSMKFQKDERNYEVTLESNTFSLLNSTTAISTSIRPPSGTSRFFSFYDGTDEIAQIPITTEGIASMQIDPKSDKKNPTFIKGAPQVYTYEIYQDNNGAIAIGLQGLSIGNHDQPIDKSDPKKPVTRDINPVECHLWVQPADALNAAQQQENNAINYIAIDNPGQLWLAYQTKDYALEQKITGSVVDFTVIRPLLSEDKAWLYVVLLHTENEDKAKAFLERLRTGKIGKDAMEMKVGDFDPKTLLVKSQPDQRGIIDDTKVSGVKGEILLADVFTPRGVGIGPFYYTILPSLVPISQLISLIAPYLNAKLFYQLGKTAQQAMNNSLIQQVSKWVMNYPSQKDSVIAEITSYIKQYGNDSLFTTDKSGKKTFSKVGTQAIETITKGPISIANLPVKQQAGVNNYVYGLGQKPSDWPQ